MNESFWDWSLRIYAKPRVENLLLSLQDSFGLNVNLLLFCLWCAERFEAPSDNVIRKATEMADAWSNEVTAPLRRVRGSLKQPPHAHAAIAPTLRTRIKKIELAAEKLEQEMLEALAGDTLTPAADRSGSVVRARRSLVIYVSLTNAATIPDFSGLLLEDLIALTISSSDPNGSTRSRKA